MHFPNTQSVIQVQLCYLSKYFFVFEDWGNKILDIFLKVYEIFITLHRKSEEYLTSWVSLYLKVWGTDKIMDGRKNFIYICLQLYI